jgi:predicted kinase
MSLRKGDRSPFSCMRGMEVSAAAIIKAFDSVNRGNGQLIMMVGLPASGKSTISDALVAAGWVRLNKDTLRKELYGDEAIQGDVKEVNRLYYQRLEEALVARKRIVVDNINLNYFFRKGTIERARLEGYRDISNVVLKVPVEECIRRNAGRERKVPDEVIRAHAATLYGGGMPTPSEGRVLVLEPGSGRFRFRVRRVRAPVFKPLAVKKS